MIKETYTSVEFLMPLICERISEGQSVRFTPRGTSMLPMLRQEKDSVVISPLPEKLKKYDIPLYQRADGQYVLHRIVAVGDTYTCAGDNQFRYEQGVTQEQMLAVVTAFYRGEKEYKVTSLVYQIYCRLWCQSRRMRYLWFRVKRKLKNYVSKI